MKLDNVMIGYKEKRLDYNLECISVDKKINKLFGYKIFSNPNKIKWFDGKNEILFKLPFIDKSYHLPTSFVISVDGNNKMFITYDIDYEGLDKPGYIIETFTYFKDKKPYYSHEVYYELDPLIIDFADGTYGLFNKQYLDGTDTVHDFVNSLKVKTYNLYNVISSKKYIKIAKEIDYNCKNIN